MGKKNSFRDKYKKQKKDIHNRQERHTEDAGGQQWGTILLKENFPDGMETFTSPAGKHKIDIIPFIAGKNHPTEAEGNIIFTLSLRVHQGIGPGDKQYVCPSFTYNKACPICEDLKARPDMDEDDRKALFAKSRNIFLIWDHTTPEEEEKGVQIWNSSFFLMKEKLDELQLDDDGGVIPYYDIEEGCHIAWTRKGEAKNTKYLGHKFADRSDPVIPDHILDQADITVDEELINMRPSYEEIYENYHGEPAKDEYDKDEKGSAEIDDDPDDDGNSDTDIPDDHVCPDEDGEFGVDFDELRTCRKCSFYDECKTAYEKSKEESRNPDNNGEEKESEGPPECENEDGEWGNDFDQHEECEDCDVRDSCEEENEEIEKAKAAAKKKKKKEKEKKKNKPAPKKDDKKKKKISNRLSNRGR